MVQMSEFFWIKAWFSKRVSLDAYSDDELLSLNYFDAGFITSFDVIQLVEEVEENFNVCFSELHFQDGRFNTMGGISEIIKELKK